MPGFGQMEPTAIDSAEISLLPPRQWCLRLQALRVVIQPLETQSKSTLPELIMDLENHLFVEERQGPLSTSMFTSGSATQIDPSLCKAKL